MLNSPSETSEISAARTLRNFFAKTDPFFSSSLLLSSLPFSPLQHKRSCLTASSLSPNQGNDEDDEEEDEEEEEDEDGKGSTGLEATKKAQL